MKEATCRGWGGGVGKRKSQSPPRLPPHDEDHAQDVEDEHGVLREAVRLEGVRDGVGEGRARPAVEQEDEDEAVDDVRVRARELRDLEAGADGDAEEGRREVRERVVDLQQARLVRTEKEAAAAAVPAAAHPGGEPVGGDGYARDELLVLGGHLALLDDEHDVGRGDEGAAPGAGRWRLALPLQLTMAMLILRSPALPPPRLTAQAG